MGEAKKEMKEMLGEQPMLFQNLMFDEMAHNALWEIFKKYELGESKIPGKYKHLIGLAVASAIHCPYCTPFHAEAAKMNGATEDEINEAAFMALTVAAFSTYLHGRQVPLDKFEEELKRMTTHMQRKAAA